MHRKIRMVVDAKRVLVTFTIACMGCGAAGESQSGARDPSADGAMTPPPVASPTQTMMGAPPAGAPPATTGAPPAPTATAPAASSAKPPPASSAKPTTGKGSDADEARVEVSGTMSDAEEKVLRAVAHCIRAGVEGVKPPSGPLDVELTVAETGRVTAVRLTPSYPPEAAKCVRPRLEALEFPKRPEAGIKIYRYPIGEVTLQEVD
jgi:hypothetical protein